MDYDHEDVDKMESIKLLSLKCKAAPTKETNLSQAWEMVKGKSEGSMDFKTKNEFKRVAGEHEIKATFTNKDFTVEWNWEPSDLNKEGMNGNLEVEAKCTPAKNDWEAKAEFKVGGFSMGPLTPWSEFQFNTNKGGDHLLTYSQNLVYENDFHCAWKTEYDMTKSALANAYGYFAWRQDANTWWWFRSNCLNKFVGLGSTHSVWSNPMTCELQYDVNKKKEGLFGQPLFWRWGYKYKLNNIGLTH